MELSIILVNFNTKELTKNCLESILEKTENITFEIIVVDNASDDNSFEELSRIFSKNGQIKFIKNKKNMGFSKANNQGAGLTRGEYLLFLNSDTLVGGNIFREIIDWMKKRKQVGVTTCALKNKDGSFQGSGGYFPTLSKVFYWMFFIEDIPLLDKLIKPFHPVHMHSFFYKGLGQFKKPRSQDWVTGAFFLVRKEVFEKAGMFDEDYFMYTEEVDLCFRIRKLGLEVWYLPFWEIVHLGGASSNKEFPILSEFKGVKLFYEKNMPRWNYSILKILLKTGAALRAMGFAIIGDTDSSMIYGKALKVI